MIAQSPPSVQRHVNLLLTATGSLVRRNLLRSSMLTISLAAILFPFIAALSVSEGIKLQSRISVDEGADFYVAGDAAGSSTSLPLSEIGRFQKLPGVAKVLPRIVGRAYFEDRTVTIVGMPEGNMPDSPVISGGSGIRKKGEVIVGSALAARDKLNPGSWFFLPVNPWKHFKVTGVFSPKCSLWSSSLIYMSLEDAGELFRMKDRVTDFLIYSLPKQSSVVSVYLQMENRADPPLRIQSRELVNSYFQRGFESRAGAFTAFYISAFALAIPLVFLLTGLGWNERRKEISTLKAVGWNSMDVMMVVVWENLFVSLASASLAIGIAFAWIRVFNGFFLVQFFLGEPGLTVSFPVPARFVPVPAFLSFLLALVLTMAGSLFNTWRTAATPPAEIMR